VSEPVASVIVTAGTTTVALAGELDLDAAPEMRERLLEAIHSGTARIVVDLAAVTFMDSTALGVLLAAHQRITVRHAPFTLRNVPAPVAAVLTHTGLNRVFTIEKSGGSAS